MTTSCTIKGTYEGRPLEVLSDLLKRRAVELGETTEQAAQATAIRILVSLRAATKKANPEKFKESWVSEDPSKWGGWYHGRRVAYPKGQSNGHINAVNAAGPYDSGRREYANPPKVYEVSEKFIGNYLVIAWDKKAAYAYAKKRHAKRVERYCGMARYIFGQAASKISGRPQAKESVSGKARTVAFRNMLANVVSNGFASGSVSVHFRDDLKYAVEALNGGKQAFTTSCMKAANAIAGFINTKTRGRGVKGSFKVPFPEVSRK